MNPRHFRPRGSAGLSLIEVMIALAISSLLILGLVQVFSASRTAYQLSEGMARVQENARFAVDYLQRDIRMAGHFGCINDQAHWVREEGDPQVLFDAVTSGSGHPQDFSVSIQGYEAPGTTPGQNLTLGEDWTLAAGLPGHITSLNPLPGSDILVLRYLASEGAPVTALTADQVTVPAGRWSVLTEGGVTAPTMFGIIDCTHATVFPGTGGPTVTATVAGTSFNDIYAPQNAGGLTTLHRAESLVYYIAANTAGVPSLFRARYNGAAYGVEELVEGIENMQLLFGQDTTAVLSADTPPVGNITEQGTAAQTLTGATTAAGQANEWRRVGLVQVGLLAVSPNPAAAGQAEEAPQRLRVLGVTFDPADTNDTRYRASYESTIALRNRLFGN